MKSRLIRGKSGYIIKYVPVINTPNGKYKGMNFEAAKSKVIRMKYPHGRNVILIDNNLTKEQKERFSVHEAIEQTAMDDNGANMGYRKAHEFAQATEHNSNILIRVKGSQNRRGSTRTIRRRI